MARDATDVAVLALALDVYPREYGWTPADSEGRFTGAAVWAVGGHRNSICNGARSRRRTQSNICRKNYFCNAIDDFSDWDEEQVLLPPSYHLTALIMNYLT